MEKLQYEIAGLLRATGIPDGHVVYRAYMPAHSFAIGRPQNVPTRLAAEAAKTKQAKPAAAKHEANRTSSWPVSSSRPFRS
ncbi:hypothetical protein [Paenibacillus sp. UNC496MF]|uniref:hypothetical protein n=1 Tax=Paenibacillus sp. UNC496MF TaxID=1502753 RepID=UPI0011605D74|nr:hypothetical protein [Paenibacillus sp. UNC496MF]